MVGDSGFNRFLPLQGEGVLFQVRFWVTAGLFATAPAAMLVRRRGPSSVWNRSGGGLLGPVALFGIVLFLTYFAATISWGGAGSLGTAKFVDVVLVLASVLLIWGYFRVLPRELLLGYFWGGVWVLGGVLALAALLTLAGPGRPERLAVFGGGPNVFGRLMGYWTLATLFVIHERRWGGMVTALSLALSLALGVMSGSRGAFVALAAGLGTYWLLARPSVKAVARAGVGPAIGALVLFMSSDLFHAAAAVFDGRVLGLLVQQQYLGGRPELMTAAFEQGLTHPWFGVGLAGFSRTGLHFYPHNLFLEVFAEGGSMGVIVLAFPILLFGFLALRYLKDYHPANTAAFVQILVSAQFSGNIFDSRGVFMLMSIGILAGGSLWAGRDQAV